MAGKLTIINCFDNLSDDLLLPGIPENFPVFPVGNNGHLGCDGFLKSLVNVTTGLLSRANAINPFLDVQVRRIHPAASTGGIEESPSGKIGFSCR